MILFNVGTLVRARNGAVGTVTSYSDKYVVILTGDGQQMYHIDDLTALDDGPSVEVDLKVAVKNDSGKPPFELIPTAALTEIAKVLDFGKGKYDEWNWAKGFDWNRLVGATMRHMMAFKDGENNDPESGLSHIAHAGCSILFLMQHILYNLGTDNRYKFNVENLPKTSKPKDMG